MIKRDILLKLRSHISKKEISLIIGPRQVGKTTLMNMLKKELEQEGKKTVFLSLDFENDKNFFSSQNNLISKIQLELGNNAGVVFIDEIQRKKNAGVFLKGIYDLNLPYKFIISGSGSVELKQEIPESLAGRKAVFEMNPVSFNEFVNFKTNYAYQDRIEDYYFLETEKVKIFLSEYLNFGGYPRVILEQELLEKLRIIDEIYHSYLEKDISYFLRVEKIDVFACLVKLLSSQIGSLANYSEMANTLGASVQTIRNYLWYLEKTFIIKKVTPYFKNTRKEITKSPLFYFYDLGLRNYSLNQFGNIGEMNAAGFVFENFIFNILREKIYLSGASIHFWRTKEKAEVDFIINLGRKIIPLEAKYKNYKNPVIERSLRSFISKYNPEKAFIINKNLKAELNIGKTKVIFIPFWEVLKGFSF
ncbi:MAG: ATPase [Candidatus Omnitrophota bacterium]|nr:MAG: ATPase [Candidatus Omnitrophota bacterium]